MEELSCHLVLPTIELIGYTTSMYVPNLCERKLLLESVYYMNDSKMKSLFSKCIITLAMFLCSCFLCTNSLSADKPIRMTSLNHGLRPHINTQLSLNQSSSKATDKGQRTLVNSQPVALGNYSHHSRNHNVKLMRFRQGKVILFVWYHSYKLDN